MFCARCTEYSLYWLWGNHDAIATAWCSLSCTQAQLRQWQESQHDQSDAYDFEKSFADFAQETARKTFELALEPEGKGRNHQKK